ncbi:hypothetical protein [Streptomyces sp. NPDC102437]|uniref:hypothetical protein n=1 Tax=Streptomyces sp. NPDC102437 TaxID=3366175 RepID=UPI00381E633E
MSRRRLTDTQRAALHQIRDKGAWHAYDGISRATIAVLERHGLVTVEWSVSTWWNRRSGRNHSQCDWTARPAEPEDAQLRSQNTH